MAGDWIKMRVNLAQDPAVIRMAGKLSMNEDEIVGKLHRFWSWANEQTENGNATGVTENWIDRYIGVTGFAKTLSEGDGKTPWLIIKDTGISIPNYQRHNSESAKKRALTSKRVSRYREGKKCNADVTQESLQKRYQRREEKRGESTLAALRRASVLSPPGTCSVPNSTLSTTEEALAAVGPAGATAPRFKDSISDRYSCRECGTPMKDNGNGQAKCSQCGRTVEVPA